MSTPRFFSVHRRKPGMVDLYTPIRPGVDQYRIKAATNFDGAFTPIVTCNAAGGYVDSVVAGNQHDIIGGEIVRMIFRPSLYTVGGNPLSDTGALWLQVAFLIGGVEQNSASANPPSAPTLVSPVGGMPNGLQVISGTAPVGAALANSLQIDLPRIVENVHIRNLSSGGNLFVAFDSAGPEAEMQPLAPEDVESIWGTVSTLWVRSSGAACPFQMSFSIANPR